MAKSYNHHEFGAYSPVPELSPYAKIDENRIKNPKFIFRHMLAIAMDWQGNDRIDTWTDVGCANGEFLHFLSQNLKDCMFSGIDITEEFVEVAQKLLSSVENVSLINENILSPSLQLNPTKVVSCTGTFQIFPDPTEFLGALLDITEPGGLLLIDGCFNKYDISMTVSYLDESIEGAGNFWRCDFNHHSEKMIRRILSSREDIKSVTFDYQTMDVEIPKQKGAPHINMWTEMQPNGGYDIVNGMGWSFNPRFLVIEKK